MSEQLKNHAYHLGGLVADLHSLEFTLRAFLHGLPDARPLGISYGADIYSQPVGTVLRESDFTSYDTLGELIDKYNVEMAKRGCALIDRTLVQVRDALSHGRVSAKRIDDDCRIIKFSKPDKTGHVMITFNETMTTAWYTAQKKRVCDAVRLVDSNVKTSAPKVRD